MIACIIGTLVQQAVDYLERQLGRKSGSAYYNMDLAWSGLSGRAFDRKVTA
jgi:hypothetical protein